MSRSHRLRDLKATWRDSWVLIRQFHRPLLAFVLIIFGGGILYDRLAQVAGEPMENLGASVYQVLSLTFLQTIGDFPAAWYLEAFYFTMPVIGIGILAHGIADFGVLFFNRRARGMEWEKAVASTYNQHIIVVGLGHLGYRIVCMLHEMNRDVVVVELDPGAHLVEAVQAMRIPVLQDDATHETVLDSAGIRQARVLISCVQNDSLNLQIAVKARSLNPAIKVIIRIFDEDFAGAISKQFGFVALSATGMAAPVFAATAAGIELTQPINLDGKPFSLAHLNVPLPSRLTGSTVAEIEQLYKVSVVLLVRNGEQRYHPAGQERLEKGDSLAVFGAPSQINKLALGNHR